MFWIRRQKILVQSVRLPGRIRVLTLNRKYHKNLNLVAFQRGSLSLKANMFSLNCERFLLITSLESEINNFYLRACPCLEELVFITISGKDSKN